MQVQVSTAAKELEGRMTSLCPARCGPRDAEVMLLWFDP